MTISEHPSVVEARARFRTYTKEHESFAAAVRAGLRRSDKSIPCRFIYDRIGSDLFDQICELPEYYPTRTEIAILEENAGVIADIVGPDACLVELGSGSSLKTRIVLDAMKDIACYAPIDVSREHLRATAEHLAREYPRLRIEAICADYSDDFPLPKRGARYVAFFPGSTIGNLHRADALLLLSGWRNRIGPRGLMIIGIDLKKNRDVLEAAYDDGAGVTEAFIRNILVRANRELGADFDLDAFAYEARYDPEPGRVEMHLRSTKNQCVHVGADRFRLKAGERIHIENSHKYSIDEAKALGEAAGFRPLKCFTDLDPQFSVHIWAV
jgi:dimethylhistidine N-methyltransferase